MANYTGEPIADRKPDDVEGRHCSTCRGSCKVPTWAKDGSWYSNNPSRFDAAVARAHRWFLPERLAEVDRARAAIRAELAVRPPAYGCRDCGKHAFPAPGTVCFWCRDVAEWRAGDLAGRAATGRIGIDPGAGLGVLLTLARPPKDV